MNVGERRTVRVVCDYPLEDGGFLIRLMTVGISRGYESHLLGSCMMRNELRFWFDQMPDLQKKLAGRGLYLFAGPVGSGNHHACFSARALCGPASHVY